MSDQSPPEGPPAYGDRRKAFRAAVNEPLVDRTVPVSTELRQYRLNTGRRDLLAGLTVAALAVPSAMAYAELAGLSPVNGLYALLLPAVAYALLGSCRQLIVGPESSVSALVAVTIASLAVAGSPEAASLAALLALLVAASFGVAWILRLGWIADYFSRPVLVGYIHGVAFVLVAGQLEKLLGLDVEARDPGRQVIEAARELDESILATVLVGAAALTLLLLARFLAPRFPGALLVVVLAIGVSWSLDLEARGVAVIGEIPAGLPSFDLPRTSLGQVLELAPAALGIFLVVFADGILTARSFAGRHGQHVRASQELLAFGGMQAAAGITQGFPVGASNSRTAVNDQMGARTQFAGLAAAAAVAVVLVLLTEPMSYLPTAVLGAVIISAAIGLVDPEAWRELRRVSRFETVIAAITTISVIGVGVLEALVLAVALSILDTVRRSAKPHDAVLGWVERLGRYADIELHPSAVVTPGVVVYRLDDRIFFANARYVAGRVREAIRGAPYEVHWLVFDAEGVTHADSTGLESLGKLVESLRSDGIEMVVARLKSPVAASFEATGITDTIGRHQFFPTVRAAVAYCEGQSKAPDG